MKLELTHREIIWGLIGAAVAYLVSPGVMSILIGFILGGLISYVAKK